MNRYTIISLFIFTLLFSGCTTKQEVKTPQKQTEQVKEQSMEDDLLNEFEEELKEKEESDPFRGYNRFMTKVNDDIYQYFLLPLSDGYKTAANKEVRESVDNFFDNLLFPMRFVNNLLQGKVSYAGEEFARFVMNSSFGIVGLFDPASKHFNLQRHPEDFGQTLGYWGVGAGPHIVLPFFGPSNLRDMVGIYPDSLLNPIDYHSHRDKNLLNNSFESLVTKTYSKVNETAVQDQYGILKKDAVDLYPYLKKSYEQYRLHKIEE